ncbi:MAG: DNA-binding protein [Anaerophaga sp.]|nr:DNA-binding protein [Anaerophaga sp.]MDN5291809.1 hypothetical protein [Anaerophaga sp.]
MDLRKEVLTVDEVSAYSGMKKSYIYKLTSSGKIPHHKPLGGKIYFSRKELENWLLQNPVKTTEQIQMEAANRVAFGKEKGGVKA